MLKLRMEKTFRFLKKGFKIMFVLVSLNKFFGRTILEFLQSLETETQIGILAVSTIILLISSVYLFW